MFDADTWTGDVPLPKLFSRTSTGAMNVWIVWVEGRDVCVRWGQEGGAMQEARFACEPKNEGKVNATTAEEQAIKEAIAKWKKQIKKKYHTSSDQAQTSRNLKPMLAKVFEASKHQKLLPAHLQPKLDGVRCFAYLKDGKVYLQSRGGDPYVIPHIQEHLQLEPGWVVDGEIYCHGLSLQTITSLARRPQEASVQLSYNVYDFYNDEFPEANWVKRVAMLNAWYRKNINVQSLKLVPLHHVFTLADVQVLHDHYVAEGYEGAIVRLHQGQYRFGYRSNELLKVKNFEDAEFPIVGYTNGKGKFIDYPIFTCITGEGLEFEVMPAGTDAERRQFLIDAPNLIGKMLTVRYIGWTEDRKPRCAVGKAIREPGT